jgi:hypothetical protein
MSVRQDRKEISMADLENDEVIGSLVAGFLVAVPTGLFAIGICLACGVGILRTIGVGLIAFIASGVATTWGILAYFAKRAISRGEADSTPIVESSTRDTDEALRRQAERN